MDEVYPVCEKQIEQAALKVSGLNRKNVFQDISFELHKGEVLGFAGMVGSGRTEILNAIFGVDSIDSGEIFINGEKVSIDNPKQAIAHKIAFIPEDRRRCGLNTIKTVRDNICALVLSKLAWCGFITKGKEHNLAITMVDQLRIKIASTDQLVSSLSGGNQQKVVIAKWLLSEPDIIFMDEPTRGIDVGAKHEIYKLVLELAKAGKAVLFVSSEMPELLGVCDKIMVLREGRIVGDVNAKEATQEMIMDIIATK
jgi:inositol transport system ATP-binding protein